MKLALVPPRPTGITTNSGIMERQRRYALADLLRGTEAMLARAKQGDWKAVDKMERERKADLVNFFRRNDQENSALLSDVISTLIALNDQIAALLQEARQDTELERQTLLHGKRAASDYLQVQDGI